MQKPQPNSFPGLNFVYRHSADGCDENILILLHGLGDTPENFIQFGVKMNLPQTALLAVKGPIPIPLLDDDVTGWYPAFDESGNDIPATSRVALDGLDKSVSLLKRFLAERVISPKGGWLNDRCFIMGFSQGGSCALQLAPVQEPDLAVNGVVSISGWPLQNLPKFKNRTKFLITQGNRDESMGLGDVAKKVQSMRQAIANPDEDMILAIIDGKKHDMPKTAGEMRHIMEFFAKNLALRNLAMEAMPDVILISEGKSMK